MKYHYYKYPYSYLLSYIYKYVSCKIFYELVSYPHCSPSDRGSWGEDNLGVLNQVVACETKSSRKQENGLTN